MKSGLIQSLSTTGPLAELFSDESVLQEMLNFEAALAAVEASLGIIPQSAAAAIMTAAHIEGFDTAALSRDTLRAGTPGIPLVEALTERVRAIDPVAAGYVHWGATSQDVSDTALVLLLKRARAAIEADLMRLEDELYRMAERHKDTVMLGRTLMRAAPPTTFGLKAAGWLGSVRRGRMRVAARFAETMIVQFGGASGTLAALGDRGLAVGEALATELGLEYPDAPWHTQRDRIAALLCACGVLTGTLAKAARDISLLMQNEVSEVIESARRRRGGSSTMPHKRNPVGCSLTLATSERVPSLVAAYLSAMVQEHERGAGGLQSEWPVVAEVIQSTGLAAASMAEVVEGLEVDKARMRANIDQTLGVVFAERAMMMLGQKVGRDAAFQILEEATRRSAEQGRRLVEVLAEMPEVSSRLHPAMLLDLEVPQRYLGVAETFRKRLIRACERRAAGA